MDGSGESGAPRAPATAALGLVFVLVGIGFGLTAATVCGIALLGLALGAVGWVELSTLRGRLERVSGPGRIEESEAYPLRIRLRHTLVPPPGGELSDPLLERSVPVGPRVTPAGRAVWLTSPGRVHPIRPGSSSRPARQGGWSPRAPSTWSCCRAPIRARAGLARSRADSRRARATPATRSRRAARLVRGGRLRPYRDGSPAESTGRRWRGPAMTERRLVAARAAAPIARPARGGRGSPGARDAPPPACVDSGAPAAATCCCRGSAVRSRSTRRSAPGPRRTCGSRSPAPTPALR
jgi:hypothetical protein